MSIYVMPILLFTILISDMIWYNETGGEKDGKIKSNVDFTRNGLAVDSGVQKNKLLTKEEEYRRKYEQLIADNKRR